MPRPTFSRLTGGLRIGPDFFARANALAAPGPVVSERPRGVVDRIADLGNPALDVTRIHPHVVRFFEDTESLELFVRSHWRFPFSIAWLIIRPLMRLVGQFVLPRREAHIDTRVLPMNAERDGRADARAILRTYAGTGEVMQAIAYATWERCDGSGTRYMSAALPTPGGQVAGILRLDANGADVDGCVAVALTSQRREGDDAGVWLLLGALPVPAPFAERLELWAAGAPAAPAPLAADAFLGATLVGRHEQRFFGVRFATHHYWFRPRSEAGRR